MPARDRVGAEIAMMRSFFARMRLDFDDATRLSERALALAGDDGIPVRARAATGLAQDAFMRGDSIAARELFERALPIALDDGDLVSAIIAIGYLVELLHEGGEVDRALRAGQRFGR